MAIKKGKLLIGLALVSLTSVGLAFGPQWGAGPGNGNRMAQELNLSAEQKDQVQNLMQKHREEGMKWREQHRKDMETQLSNVLTGEQMAKFKDLKQQGPSGRGMKKGAQRKGRDCGMRPL